MFINVHVICQCSVTLLLAKCQQHSRIFRGMFKYFVIIPALFASSLSANDVRIDNETISIENTYNCYADYLKRHGIIEDNFESQPFDGQEVLCEMILESTVNRVYAELYKEFSANENFKTSAGCIVKSLRDSKWSDLDIKEQIYEVSDLLTLPEKQLKILEIKQQQEKISGDAIFSCLSEQEFGELFDSIISNATFDDDDLVGDYCARKYGIENNLIDTNEYEVNLNPSNIITTYIQCDVVNRKHFDDAESELRKHLLTDAKVDEEKVNCYMKKYHENHYFDKTLAVALLGELKLNDQQRERERKKFLTTMINITRIISEC